MPFQGPASTSAPYQGSLSKSDTGLPSTPDGTNYASRATGEWANSLPKDKPGIVRVIKGLLTEHPPNSPNNWQMAYWRGRCFVSLERLSVLSHPCYLAWYHTVIAYYANTNKPEFIM
jgi:hypothetical protein